MTEAELIARLRRRVLDVPTLVEEVETVLYADVYYQDAISRSVEWLNVVFCVEPPLLYAAAEDPSGLEEIDRPYSYLVELKAAIEMARIRAAEATDRDAADTAHTETVEVPNLTVTKKRTGYTGPAFWMRLAEALQKELDDLLRRLERVGDHAVRRTSPVTDTIARHALDSPLRTPAVNVTYDEIGEVVTLEWEPLRDPRFHSVTVLRSSSSRMTSPREIGRSSNPHKVRFLDADVPAGVWYYQVVHRSKSGIESKTGALVVEV